MRIPVIRGIIDRRILANFRVAPDVLARVLPPPFRPQIVSGFGIAGVCLIRLKQIRPRFLPPLIGISSENAAHRIVVEWESGGKLHTGVFIPRRDTSSLLNAFAGGRIFPRVHKRAYFDVREDEKHFHVAMESLDGSAANAIRHSSVLPLLSRPTFSQGPPLGIDCGFCREHNEVGIGSLPPSGRYTGCRPWPLGFLCARRARP